MSKQFVQNNYKVGNIVYAKINPELKLVIRRYVDQVYYCIQYSHPERKDSVYYERELIGNTALIAKNRLEMKGKQKKKYLHLFKSILLRYM